MRTTLVLSIAFALSFAGCIQNIAGLKETANDTQTAVEQTLDQATTSRTNATATNASVAPPKPPVARITVFAAGGALLFKSTFQAEHVSDIIRVDQGSAITLIAADSEAIEPGATLTSYAWSLDGKPIEGGRQATAVLDQAGIRVLSLVVTDSKGTTDDQSIRLGVAPKPIEMVTELTTGPIAGAVGLGVAGETAFDLSLAPAGVPAKITSVSFLAAAPTGCDIILTVTGPEGDEVGSVDSTSTGAPEVLNAGELPEGTYAIAVEPYSCAAPDGTTVTVTVVYTPIIEGLEDDGHGGHAH